MIHTFQIPYSMALSKNQRHGYAKGKVWTQRQTQTEMDAISYLCMPTRNAWRKEKINVHIYVFRPDMKGDPVNFQDVILDGIKIGIGIDDNVYECSTTWEVDKTNPRVVITVSQGDKDDQT
jgi:hypothetical protein